MRRSAVVSLLMLSALGGLTCLVSSAKAQIPEVMVTYNNENGEVQTDGAPIENGEATPDPINTSYEGNGDSVDSGDAMIISPVIDPRLNLSLTVFNNSTETFLSEYRFSLPEGVSGLYFFDPGRTDPYSPFSSIFQNFAFERPVLNQSNQYLDLVFTTPSTTFGVRPGESVTFVFPLMVPEPTETQRDFILDHRVNGARPIVVATAPEPGALALLFGAGMPVGAIAFAKRCRRKKRG
jgi:hypothetical protein